MIARTFVRFRFTFLFVCATLTARADVRLPGLFSDHMVLQQNARVAVWGWADEGETVTVQFRDQKATAKTKSGTWRVHLSKLQAGGPDPLTVSGKNRVALNDVLVGEVWVCSGQSNMEFPLKNALESEADIAASANPMIRLFVVPKTKADLPLDDVKAAWQECNPQTTPGFSAVAYYFGRDLQRARHVPVGLIQSDWGGSPAEVWMSQAALEAEPDYRVNILGAYSASLKKYQEAKPKFDALAAELKKQGKTVDARQTPRAPWKPTELYNGMIAPLMLYAIKGAIWYQGESNAGRAHQYRHLFADLIRNWRNDWGQGDFPFLAVQLAPYKNIQPQPAESDWAELREAQLLATQTLPKVGLAVITDVGEENDIHPKKKQPVGARLAVAARGIAYGEKIEFSGPIYLKLRIKNGKAIVSFEHVGAGLQARGGELQGFTIAGADRKFVRANAEIKGSTVEVSSPDVPKPVAVRFGWADYPVVNLWNEDGLPATPFRTDNFPMFTAPKPAAPKK